jgi:hypothetical protein
MDHPVWPGFLLGAQGDEEHRIKLPPGPDRTGGLAPGGQRPSSEIRKIGPHTKVYGIWKAKFPKIFIFLKIFSATCCTGSRAGC